MNEKASNRLLTSAPYVSIFLPFALGVFYTYMFGVNVFFADEWDFVVLVEKLHSGTLSVADLFARHNEHIYFFPWIVMLALGHLTDYDTVPLMYLVQFCLLATTLILFFAFRRNLGYQPPLSILLFIPIPFLVFSLRQFENMLWGNQITFAFAQMFALLALYLLHMLAKQDPERLLLLTSFVLAALVSATIASFSAVQGLLVWPVGVFQLVIAPVKRWIKIFVLGSWGLIGLGVWIFYFTREAKKSLPSAAYVLGHPASAVDYFLTLLGGSLFGYDEFAFSGGLLLLCLVLAALLLSRRSGSLKENSFWIALLFFSLLSLMAITLGRFELGAEKPWAQAVGSRYTTFSILAVVGVYATLAAVATRERSPVAVAFLGGLLGLVLLSVPTSYSLGVEGGEFTKRYREELAVTLLNYEAQPDSALTKSGNRPSRIREYAPFLERQGYNVFSAERE
jgi:hypothetical protein